jgi:pilus assembly protein FimV
MMPDALGASTQPYTAPAKPPAFQPAADATLDAAPPASADDGLDLDLEFDLPSPGVPPASAPAPFTESTQAFGTGAQMGGDETMDLSLEPPGDQRTIPVARPAAAPPADDNSLDFDLGALANEPPTIAIRTPAPPPAPSSGFDFGDFSIGGEPLTAEPQADAVNDPLARKLELAEEFRQIGDLEGARDLLEEVVAKGAGPLQAKAQGMLDKLA